jgi:hypothetical protein
VELCIFCPNHRTKKRGEHVWDDWLNREGGRDIIDPSTTYYFGSGGEFIRSHPSIRMGVTLPVVCDTCNHTWMSTLSSLAKDLLEPTIRRNRARDFNEHDILTVTSFAFLKSAVLDWSATAQRRKPCLSRAACLRFRDSLLPSAAGGVVFPDGLQVWIARYRRTHRMEALAFTEEMTGARQFKGYKILVVTYVVGSFIFQLTCPRWVKAARNRPAAPFFEIVGDLWSVPIWPGMTYAYWPPLSHVDNSALEAFRERFRRVHIRRE